MADLERLGVQDFAVNLELARDLLELLFLIGHAGLVFDPSCSTPSKTARINTILSFLSPPPEAGRKAPDIDRFVRAA